MVGIRVEEAGRLFLGNSKWSKAPEHKDSVAGLVNLMLCRQEAQSRPGFVPAAAYENEDNIITKSYYAQPVIEGEIIFFS